MPIDRRLFMSGAAAAGASLLGAPGLAASKRVADLRIAVVGVRGRGREHLMGLGKNVVAVCDIDREVLDKQAQLHGEKIGRELAKYVDYREMLQKEDLDGVAIATPNHTHCLIGIATLEAGKHVYTEKPISHNVWEGRQLVAAARKHDRLVQCGTQSRSSPSLMKAVDWVRSGQFGEVQYAIGTCYKPRKAIGKLDQPLRIPDTIEYDLWCGPAEMRDLYRPQLHYDWHWDTNTGNGDMGNQGIHQMDIARWFLGEEGMAPRTMSLGGRLGYDDAADTPNTQVVYHDYAAAPLIFETRGLPRSKAAQKQWGSQMDRYRGSGIGVLVQCEGGHLLIPSYTEAIAFDRAGKKVEHWRGGGDHFRNWLEAIVAGDRSLLNGEIQEGHVSSALCHIGGASHTLGEKMPADEIAASVAANPLLSGAFDRMAAHLRANDVNIDGEAESLTLGPWIDVDAETERFTGPSAAEKLFRRDDRAEFRVTDLGA